MLRPDTSLASLDCAHYVPDDSLLAESLTLSSLSSSTSSTPPLPAGCMVPLSVIIGHFDGPIMLQPSIVSRATPTAPTPPRLRTMIKEKLLIETWLNGVDPDAAEHTPWGDVTLDNPVPWKSEGSLYTPQVFKSKISSARRSQSPDEQQKRDTETETPVLQSRRATNRNALVFEREIILHTDGNSNRVSLQADADAMDPEVAAMLSELQDLNSFFKKQDALPPPPSLIVSNSHFSLPVSFESPSKQLSKTVLPLAARRGKVIPPVATKHLSDGNDYPGMPTAFLGSPSAYSPQFEFSPQQERSSMDLQEMVTSLRSQCASMEPASPVDERTIEVTPPTPEEDEWAFADGILDFYSPSPFESQFIKKPLRPDLVEYAAESFSTRSPSRTESLNGQPSAPPSTPLPPCPSPVQRVSVRSILKSSKSVRFAEELEVDIAESPVPPPRSYRHHSTPPKPRDSMMPSRPRSTIHDPFRSPPPKSVPKLQSRPTTRQRRATTPASFGSNSPSSSPARTRGLSVTTETNTNTNANAGSGVGVSPVKDAIPASGRHSLGRVFAKEKENKIPSGREMRRASMHVPVTGSAVGTTTKSRMPVPLRNILTRFK